MMSNEPVYVERVVTLQTRLENADIGWYYNKFMPVYSKMCRRIWQDLKHNVKCDSKYVSAMQKKYGFMKRTVNSALRTMKGRINAQKELTAYQMHELEHKVSGLEGKILKQKANVSTLKARVVQTPNDKQLVGDYHNAQRKLYAYQDRLNKYKVKLKNYKDGKLDELSLCFGTKKLFSKQYRLDENNYKTHEKWLNDFRKARDHEVDYIGSNDETCGNQQFQVSYDERSDTFLARVRLEKRWENDKKWLEFPINFVSPKRTDMINIMDGSSFSYKVIKRGRKWYLFVSFRILYLQTTNKSNGCIGLDFNNGFIAWSETDKYGNMINKGIEPLKYHGGGNKAKSEIKCFISDTVKYAKSTNKAICIENLKFSKKKSQANKGDNKKYNKMIHALDYSRYKQSFEDCCIANGVMLREVNPAYTSIIGRRKYSDSKKLNNHVAASYVIARRGQGFRDYY